MLIFFVSAEGARRYSVRNGVLKNLAKITEKHLLWSLFFNNIAGQGLQFY